MSDGQLTAEVKLHSPTDSSVFVYNAACLYKLARCRQVACTSTPDKNKLEAELLQRDRATLRVFK